MTHPDGFAVDYTYDVLNRPKTVKNGAKTLATVSYDSLGRRQSVAYGPFETPPCGGSSG